MKRTLVPLLAIALVAGACGSDSSDNGESAAGALSGTLALDAGVCADDGAPAGSYFRMVQSGGTVADGPYVTNGDSPCADTTFTPLTPGTDGGLVLGAHQPNPDPEFDETGNALASAIAQPATFFAVGFAMATNPVDPQTGTEVAPPELTAAADGSLSGDLRSFAVAWNGQHFNQGAPKPDGTTDDATTGPTGTYDAATGHTVVEWTSQIAGGPFDGFTGLWHLEGTITP